MGYSQSSAHDDLTMHTTPSITEQDMSTTVWFDSVTDPLIAKAFQCSVRTLRADGFTINNDKAHDALYPSLKGTQKYGRKGVLEVIIERCGRSVKVAFFQNVVHENSHGGQYDFNKYEKAPYLVRLAYLKARNRLDTAWQALGLPCMQTEDQVATRGKAFIERRERELNEFQRWTSKPIPDRYNALSRAKRIIIEGDQVFFSKKGRWLTGTAYHNINNMWWVLDSGSEVHNLASFELIHRGDLNAPLKGRQIEPARAIAQINRKLAQQVAAEAFDRAASLRDRRDQLQRQLELAKAA